MDLSTEDFNPVKENAEIHVEEDNGYTFETVNDKTDKDSPKSSPLGNEKLNADINQRHPDASVEDIPEMLSDCEEDNLDMSEPSDCEKDDLDMSEANDCEKDDLDMSEPSDCEKDDLDMSEANDCEKDDLDISEPNDCEKDNLDVSEPNDCEEDNLDMSEANDCEKDDLDISEPNDCEKDNLDVSEPNDCEEDNLDVSEPNDCEEDNLDVSEPNDCEEDELDNEAEPTSSENQTLVKKKINSGFHLSKILAKSTNNGSFKFFKRTKSPNLSFSEKRKILEGRKEIETQLEDELDNSAISIRQVEHIGKVTRDDVGKVEHTCPVCNKNYSSRFSMRRHVRSIHEQTQKKTAEDKKRENEFFCDLCGKDFSSGYTLKRHKYRAHCPDRVFLDTLKPVKTYSCKYEGCTKVFSNSSNYKKHYDAVHLNLRKHLCEVCSFMFKTKGALRVHMGVCHEDDPMKSHTYECSICMRRFTSKGKLTVHETVHTNLKPYLCTFEGCGRAFRLKHNLRKHSVVHRNDKPYVCDICGKGFTRKVYLQSHQYKHTGIKNFKCGVCEKMFSQQGNLNIHLKTHGEQYAPYRCDLCNRAYTTMASLTKHKLCHYTKPGHGDNGEGLEDGADSVDDFDTEKLDNIILENATEEEFEEGTDSVDDYDTEKLDNIILENATEEEFKEGTDSDDLDTEELDNIILENASGEEIKTLG